MNNGIGLMPSYIIFFFFPELTQLTFHHYNTEFKLPKEIIPNCGIDGYDVSSFELNNDLVSRLTRYSEYSRPRN